MDNILEMPNRFYAQLQRDINSGDLVALCRYIGTVDSKAARTLPLKIKQWLACALVRVDYGVYVEECLHPVRAAADAFCWSIQTLDRSKQAELVETSRRQLIESVMVLDEELRLCPAAAIAI